MNKTVTLTEHANRFVAMKQQLGYRFTTNETTLRSFVRFAEDRDETVIQANTALEWAAAGVSRHRRVKRLHTVHAFAAWLHAEDARHEVPHREALGPRSHRRPSPYLVSLEEIQALLTAALSIEPEGTLTPLTWHHLFGLIAATGLRISEALSLTLEDLTPDGLIIRDTKFRKSRMVALHPTTWEALNRYLVIRRKAKTQDDHLFVLASTSRPPSKRHTETVFRRLTEQVGIRKPGAPRGPTLHSLRHSFAVRSIENLAPEADPSRHMLALATYLGHANVSDTYWYLKATPVLLQGIADATERSHAQQCGGSHD